MRMLWRRRVLAVALCFAAAGGGPLLSGTAHAQAVATGSLSFSGDSGDYISQGKSYSYSTSKGDALKVSSANGATVSISVNGYNGDWWTLDFDAPGTPDQPVTGQSAILAPGTYTGAHRYPFNGTGPGLSLSGEGRGCNELTGSFTVTRAVFGAQGYVQTFDATFEQHCEGGNPAARGEVHISNPPPPRPAAPKHTAAASPHASSTRPHATPTSRRATPTSRPSATTTAGGNDTAADNTSASTRTAPVAVSDTFRAPLLLIRAGVLAWVVLASVGLVTVGTVLAVRRP